MVHSIGTVEQLDQINSSKGVPVVFERLAKLPVHLAFRGAQSDTLSVWSTESDSGFISKRNLHADVVTIRFVDRGTMARANARGDDTFTSFDQASFSSYEEMSSQQASPGFSAITAAVSRRALLDAYIALGGHDGSRLPSFDRVVDVRSVSLRSLRTTLTLLRDQMLVPFSDSDLMTPLLRDLLIYQIISAWPAETMSADGQGHGPSDRPVRLAIDYIEANLRRRLDIAEIAGASGLPVRGLQNAFKKTVGCSPVHFLIARRLDKVHASLRASDTLTVRQVATEWGFTHMSDFTRRYSERFGQTPALLRRTGSS